MTLHDVITPAREAGYTEHGLHRLLSEEFSYKIGDHLTRRELSLMKERCTPEWAAYFNGESKPADLPPIHEVFY